MVSSAAHTRALKSGWAQISSATSMRVPITAASAPMARRAAT